jgi:hypothetical protein
MGRALPSEIVALLTFPGVVLHEVAEVLFCRWSDVAVLGVCFFQFGDPAGYVNHEPDLDVRKSLWIAIGPFLVCSLLGVLIALPCVLAAMEFRVLTVQGCVLAWLGISIATHAFPGSEDAINLWRAVRDPRTPPLLRRLATPVVGFLRILSAGHLMGLDLLYGIAIVAGTAALLLHLLG